MAGSGLLCAVDGCRSSKRRDKHLSFFSLPADTEIRKTWIELIARPDLARPETKRTSYFVCSLHFDPSVIKYKPQLQLNALPTKLLPSQPTTSKTSNGTKTKECSTQTKLSTINKSAVTFKKAVMNSESAQTTEALSSDTPSKIKPNKDLKDSKVKRRKLQNELENE